MLDRILTSDMDPDATIRAIVRNGMNPSEEEHTATMEGLADAYYIIMLALMEAAEKRGVKFKYNA